MFLALAAGVVIPAVVCLIAATRALGAVPESASGVPWGGLTGRALLLVLLASPLYLLFAWSAAAGVRVGSVERWVIWVHWLIGAAAFQSEGWRLMAWTFAREAAGVFGKSGAATLGAFLAQGAPYLVFWGALLHMLIPECEIGTGGPEGPGSPLASAARHRLTDLAWALWPPAMTGLVALDVVPGFWRNPDSAGDIGPLGLWLLGLHPSPSEGGPGAVLSQAAANTAGMVWVLAGIAILAVAIFLIVRRTRRGNSREAFSSGDSVASTIENPSPVVAPDSTGSVGMDNLPRPGTRVSPRLPRKKGDAKAFTRQFIVLNLGLFLVIIPPAYGIIASLFTFVTESSSVRAGGSISAATGALGGSKLLVGVGFPAVVALALGSIGWLVARSGREDSEPAQSPNAFALSGNTVTILAFLAFWPLGLRWASGLMPDSIEPGLLSTLATWAPNGLILVPLALVSLGPSRRGWFLPMAAAALILAWVPMNLSVLPRLAGPDYAERLFTSPGWATAAAPGWPGTGLAATSLVFISLVVVGVPWLLAVAVWPRRK